jgi:hypothetical protein
VAVVDHLAVVELHECRVRCAWVNREVHWLSF